MSTFRVALAQQNYTVGDITGNTDKIISAIQRARNENADLVVFSELALVGYPPQDLLKRESFINTQYKALNRVAEEAVTITVLVGFAARNPHEYGKPIRNAIAICRGGEVVGQTTKRLLPTYDVFDEDRYFEAVDTQPIYELSDSNVCLGVSLCEDAWNEPDIWERPQYDADPIEDLVSGGTDLLVNCSASPFYGGKGAFRKQLFSAHATDHGKWLVFVNQVGANDELIFDGRSFVVAPDGTIACQLAVFEEDFAVYDVPLDARSPREHDIADEPTGSAEIRDALALGIRDYVHKSGFETVLVGLSGGIDSSVTAALAVDALGPRHVLGVAMPTRYTSDESKADARTLAANLDIDFLDVPIEDTFESFEAELVSILDATPGVTEENVQARIRGTTLMAIANEQNRLLLTTGNRSELAVGYCTLYGDMCGALAPLADCPKTLVYDLAEQMNEHGDIIPQRVIEKPPSAELRADQTDEDDLPPYDLLDSILAGYVDDGKTAAELVESGYDRETVHRVLLMLHRSEYKRFQAAPVLKVSPKAFGVGWRYPLAARYGTVLPE